MVGCAQLVVDDADSSLPAGGGRVPGSTGFLTGPQGDGAHAYDLQSLTTSPRRPFSLTKLRAFPPTVG